MESSASQAKQLHIEDLHEHFSDKKFTIVGSPKGVGFSTLVANWVAHKLFFNNDFSIIVLTDSRRSKIDMLFKIKKTYDIFQCPLIQDGDMLHTKSKRLSGVYVLNYDEFPLENLSEIYDLIIIDKDDCSDYLYDNIINLSEHAKQVLFNTYDVPQSLFHNLPDVDRVVLHSEYSKDNWKLAEVDSNVVNYHKIVLGSFKPL